MHHQPHGARDVGCHFCFSQSWLLKVDDVVKTILVGFAHHIDCRLPRAPPKGHRHSAYRFHPRGLKQGKMPGDGGPPIVTYHRYLFMTQVVHRSLNVGAKSNQIVGFDRFRSAAGTVTAHFRDVHSVALVGQHFRLMSPGVPALWKTVQQPDWPTVSGASGIQT